MLGHPSRLATLLTLLLFWMEASALGAAAPIPTRSESVGLTAFIELVQKNQVSSTGQLMDLYGGRINVLQRKLPSVLDFRDSRIRVRYLYSPKWGWVDMLHFSAGAWTNSLPGIHGYRVLKWGEDNERAQEEAHENSRWDYEDLISNLLGTVFSEYLDSLSWFDQRDFPRRLSDFLSELGFVENPETASNWADVPLTESQDDTRENRHYIPWFTQCSCESEYGVLDRSVISFLDGYLKWMGRSRSEAAR